MTDGQRLLAGRYVVGEVIGRGGMADVHRGEDTKLGRTVAIKILKAQLALDPAFRTRFRQEAQAASRMAHPTIVRVFDAGEETVTRDDGEVVREPFIVMEYVEGRLLKDMIAEGPLGSKVATDIVIGILTALEYSHRAGVVHRDIKPGNVMITPDDTVKVMDFGIARAVSDSSSTVAQTTAILGTASYFSPEQAKGETVDARTDLYSTGVVLFEMLTGRAPFQGETAVSVAYQHVSETPVRPSSVNPDVSPALDEVVLRALGKGRFDRYQTAPEFMEEVELAAAGHLPKRRVVDDSATAIFGTAPTAGEQTAHALRQLTSDDTVTRTQRRPPVVWIWAGVSVIAVVMVAVLIWVLNLAPNTEIPTTSRIIPELSDTTWEEAQSELTGLDLVPTRLDEASSTIDEGDVIRTDPPATTSVEPGQTVQVFVSTGAEQVTVPDLSNLDQAAATAKLEESGLELGSITDQNSPTIAAGIVMGASPASGTETDAGASVDLVLSNGKVTITDVTGQTMSIARQLLEDPDIGLTVEPVADAACVAETGEIVTAQSLAPGEVDQGSTIQLTYCTGAPEGDPDDGTEPPADPEG
ncbi:Stk1 family PASTA domain-containing Ser/Thr kinase [Labedella endophytica]|uniref:non-specific serine/threonine protein kinase n=1 Tax=Labedella endophytica TaxID=1523160 RepID=A0A3S0V8N1_9MICO|nr:Stk1 family PASTA domain-containing Ser/Thr kinase [Labedella endophytica]RUQ98043.1 Stk1 family PASTA domain-containing Ser/Thr kinase [Labedella endophytica]